MHYAQVTAGGRIAFGRGGGAIGPAGRVTAGHHRDPRPPSRAVAADFRRFFPHLDDVRLTHAWGGPVDRAPWHLPFAGSLGDHGNVHYAAGYSGNGVAPSLLLARVLAALTLEADDDYARCGLVGGPPGVPAARAAAQPRGRRRPQRGAPGGGRRGARHPAAARGRGPAPAGLGDRAAGAGTAPAVTLPVAASPSS